MLSKFTNLITSLIKMVITVPTVEDKPQLQLTIKAPESDDRVTVNDVLTIDNSPVVNNIIDAVTAVSNKRRVKFRDAIRAGIYDLLDPVNAKRQYVDNSIIQQEIEQKKLQIEAVKRVEFMNTKIKLPVSKISTFDEGVNFDGIWHIKTVLTPGAEGEAYIVTSVHDIDGPEYVLKFSYYITDLYTNTTTSKTLARQIEKEVNIYKHLDKMLTDPADRSRFPALITKNPITVVKKRKKKSSENNITFVYFVISKFTSGSINNYLDSGAIITSSDYYKLVYGYLELIYILHKAGVVHHDAHESNTFMGDVDPNNANSKFKLKLIDFGRAKIVSEKGDTYTLSEKNMMSWLFMLQLNTQQLVRRTPDEIDNIQRMTISAQEMYYFDYMYLTFVFFGAKLEITADWERDAMITSSIPKTIVQRIMNKFFFDKFDPFEVDIRIPSTGTRLKVKYANQRTKDAIDVDSLIPGVLAGLSAYI